MSSYLKLLYWSSVEFDVEYLHPQNYINVLGVSKKKNLLVYKPEFLLFSFNNLLKILTQLKNKSKFLVVVEDEDALFKLISHAITKSNANFSLLQIVPYSNLKRNIDLIVRPRTHVVVISFFLNFENAFWLMSNIMKRNLPTILLQEKNLNVLDNVYGTLNSVEKYKIKTFFFNLIIYTLIVGSRS